MVTLYSTVPPLSFSPISDRPPLKRPPRVEDFSSFPFQTREEVLPSWVCCSPFLFLPLIESLNRGKLLSSLAAIAPPTGRRDSLQTLGKFGLEVDFPP